MLPKLYTHNLKTIELTKLLERSVCDNLTVTNNLGHVYEPGQSYSIGTWEYRPENAISSIYQKGQINVPIIVNEPLTLPTASELFNLGNYADSGYNWKYNNSYTIKVIQNDSPYTLNGNVFTPLGTGNYTLEYSLQYLGTLIGGVQTTSTYFICDFPIGAFQNIQPSPAWTITDVVNRILSAGVTRRQGIETQRFTFDITQAEQYSNVLAPEFFFTKSTLWDALNTVGGFIHAIPRLVPNPDNDIELVLKFDTLSGEEEYTGTLPPEIFEDISLLGDEFCGATDSQVENLLNTTDRTQGATTEPSSGSFRAVNSEEVKINADTMTILTDDNIYQMISLTAQWDSKTYNLTPFVYEASEYQTLSGYAGATFPYSKSYALVYTQNQANITGLNFVVTGTTGQTLASNYSIVNILQSLGASISNSSDFTQLSFQVQYIPTVATRLIQKKVNVFSHPINNALIYNQDGNTVESEYYGARAKGVLARIGLKTERKTYEFAKLADIPKVGQKIGNKYVVSVDKEYDRMRIKATLTLTENYNKLAEFVGVNSNYRLYDISEKQAVERYVAYGESVVISNSIIPNKGYPMITLPGIHTYESTLFVQTTTLNSTKATACGFKFFGGKTQPTSVVATIGVKCNAFAYGNSLCFAAKTIDNYGAGYDSETGTTISDKNTRISRLVPYSDDYGNISVGDMYISRNFSSMSSIYDYPSNPIVETVLFSTSPNNPIDSSSTDNPLIIQKDSREALRFVYQLHHQTDNADIVIGKALCNKSFLVTTPPERTLKICWCRTLNMLSDTVEVVAETDYDITPTEPIITDGDGAYFSIFNGVENTTGQTQYAIALVDTTTNELYVGQNFPNGFNEGDYLEPLVFNFLDNNALAKYTKTI